MMGFTTPAERRQLFENALLAYCEGDTLAMMVQLAAFFADADSASMANPQD